MKSRIARTLSPDRHTRRALGWVGAHAASAPFVHAAKDNTRGETASPDPPSAEAKMSAHPKWRSDSQSSSP
uniref:Uncharacterized protein n=1 Tax=Rhodococcus hoagii TaxID=43767 RepID=A0A1Z1UYX7_RHOHA|nr:hypothetical protein pVAPB1533_0805 [Prescottella equi]